MGAFWKYFKKAAQKDPMELVEHCVNTEAPHLIFLALRLLDEDVNFVMENGHSLLLDIVEAWYAPKLIPALAEHDYLDMEYTDKTGCSIVRWASWRSERTLWMICAYMRPMSPTLLELKKEWSDYKPQDFVNFHIDAMNRSHVDNRDWAAMFQGLLIMVKEGYLKVRQGQVYIYFFLFQFYQDPDPNAFRFPF